MRKRAAEPVQPPDNQGVSGVTNARTEAANTAIKQIKRSGRGYRNQAYYRARILLASAARRAA
jgi:transposase